MGVQIFRNIWTGGSIFGGVQIFHDRSSLGNHLSRSPRGAENSAHPSKNGRGVWLGVKNSVILAASSLVPGAEEERLVHTDALPIN